ncbi:DUF3472 domain-containing protein [Pedobacter insulae]|uniref:DUF5077 domain-containing protein n=1 Tax=Pedobacter insulae TaxID=414048 RepID=A0A1I2TBK0_9SPHI|nr:DUF3472 domain-containing protein [Pedobacter insulae]SFG61489.1 protein of unknown function [Pedobacter insulae]
MMRKQFLTAIFVALLSNLAIAQSSEGPTLTVPLGGNTYASPIKNGLISKGGINSWNNPETSFKVYVRLAQKGNLAIAINQLTKIEGESELSIAVNKKVNKVIIKPGSASLPVGIWAIKDTGYVTIEIKGLKKSGAQFPAIGSLQLAGTAIDAKTTFVKDNEGNFFYWGRRGPSVHLNYQLPEKTDIEWFYNEITVPKGEDIQGSYYMTNGFAEGYFGIQVNSPTERRILFSVWSPFVTDNPKEIPENQKIKLLKKGKEVYTGEFGNEGSGGQSYFKYDWKAGESYSFLLRAAPSDDNYTTYTAYFFMPELNDWKLIASFKRPQTKTYLKRLHSFLENFNPEFGDQSRMVLFKNQWVCDSKGVWTEINTAKFTTDNTGNKGYRMDYGGGVKGTSFYLQNCGFFSDFTIPRTNLKRKVTNQRPLINFNYLP